MFFFSSRRRHTRYWRDWSSDVCSSDLSAVTSNSIAVINSLENLQKVSFKEVHAGEGSILCRIVDADLDKAQLLLQHLRLALDEIRKEYPKNIKIFEK